MTLLLDTHLLLWAAREPERMPEEASRLLSGGQYEVVYSVVNLWEIAIKFALRREDFTVDPAVMRVGLRRNGYRELEVTGDHALEVGRLPAIHRDPFDRMLVAQATVEGMMLLTSDPVMGRYGGVVRLV